MFKNKGFTLTEVLVTVVIVGILFTLASMSYNSVVKDSQISAIKSDLQMIAKKLETAYLKKSNPDETPFTSSGLNSEKFTVSKPSYQKISGQENLLVCVDNSNFFIIARTTYKDVLYITSLDKIEVKSATEDQWNKGCQDSGLNSSYQKFAGYKSDENWAEWIKE